MRINIRKNRTIYRFVWLLIFWCITGCVFPEQPSEVAVTNREPSLTNKPSGAVSHQIDSEKTNLLKERSDLTARTEPGTTWNPTQGAAGFTNPTLPISIQVSSLTSPSSNLGDQSANHQPSGWSIFMDGTAAIFGVLSAGFAILVAYLAVKGLATFGDLRTQLHKEVKEKIQADLDDRVVKPAFEKMDEEVRKAMSEKIKGALEEATSLLRKETTRLAQEPQWSEAFIREVTKRVLETTQPKKAAVTPEEFDDPSTSNT